MGRLAVKSAWQVLKLVVAFALAIGLFTVVRTSGWLSPFGIESTSRDAQVINAIERTQEVSLLSLGVQGIKQEERNSEIFGQGIPGTSETVLLTYEFDAKLGLDGTGVDVTTTSDHAYRVSVPKFTFIGFGEPTFKVVVDDNGVFGFATPDIETVDLVNEILDDSERQSYIDSNEDLLQEQAEVFYDSLITSVDPDAAITYDFS